MTYSLFFLPPYLPESSIIYFSDTLQNFWSGYYSFGTDGLNLKLNGNLGSWRSSLLIRDVGGLSGEVKRLEELQEFRALVSGERMGFFGGILTEDFMVGRFRGEGLGIFYGNDTLKFLRTISDVKRISFRLIKGYNGPYILPEKILRGSVRVYLNGRVLEGGYEIKDGAIYLRDFEDGDILTVEYQEANGERISVFGGILRKGGFFLRGFSKEAERGEKFKGCFRGKGDYKFSNDTFYIDVKNGDLICDFVRVENGDYIFLGDRFVFVGSGGNYTIRPLEGVENEGVGSLGYSSGESSIEISANTNKNFGSNWNFKLGKSVYFFSFGNLGYNPYVPLSKVGVSSNKNINLGFGAKLDGLFGEMGGGFTDGKSSSFGRIKLGKERGIFGEFFNSKVWENYKFGGFISSLSLSGITSRDTFGRSYGFSVIFGSLSSNLKRYEDGFLSFALEFDGENIRFNYGKTKLGRSLSFEWVWMFFRMSLNSSVSFKKEERFVYVGKGWGDYERDSSGNFYPKPFGSYKREILYFPTDTPTYDLNFSIAGNLNLSLRTDLNSIKSLNLSTWYLRDSLGLSFQIFRDEEVEREIYERNFRGYIYKVWFLEGESFYKAFGREIFYNSLSFGYKFFGFEVLKGASWALSPFFRIKSPFSLSAYYRFYTQAPGPEGILKPPGPSLYGTFSLSKEFENLKFTGYLNFLYNQRDKFSWNFGLNVFGGF